jgi:hypothetical protein
MKPKTITSANIQIKALPINHIMKFISILRRDETVILFILGIFFVVFAWRREWFFDMIISTNTVIAQYTVIFVLIT